MPAKPADDGRRRLRVSADRAGQRLDAFLAREFPAFSRVQLQRAISQGGVSVDGKKTRPSFRLRVDQTIAIEFPQPQLTAAQGEDIPLDILWEDNQLIVVNKPPRMVVHPAKGHVSGTLVSALTYHFRQLSTVGGAHRPGIVHRLDRDTSGVLVVAKTDRAHQHLSRQFAARSLTKEYLAIVASEPDRDRDVIEQPIGMHPRQREKMAVRKGHTTSREAVTFYEVIARSRGFGVVRVLPKTGRTHQIRVHFSHLGWPVLCDAVYGGRSEITQGELTDQSPASHVLLDRQALHARRITFRHPENDESITVTAPIRADMQAVLDALGVARSVDN